MDIKSIYIHKAGRDGRLYQYKKSDVGLKHWLTYIGYMTYKDEVIFVPGGSWGYKTKYDMLRWVRRPTAKERVRLMLGAL